MNKLDLETQKMLDTALEQINSIRTCLLIGEGKLKELPRAIPEDSLHCVIAKALSNGWRPDVDEGVIELRYEGDYMLKFEDIEQMSAGLTKRGFYVLDWDGDYIEIETTPEFRELIRRFDEREFEFLILEK